MERKALKLHQDCVEEARLDCLVMEIIEHKKKAVARRIQLEQNLAKEKEAVKTLAVMIRQSRADNITIAANEKKLKEEKESKRGVMAHVLSSLSKLTESPLTTTTPPPTTAPSPTSTSSFSHVLSPNNSTPQPAVEVATTAWVSSTSTIGVAWTILQLVGTEFASLISSYIILGDQKCPPLSTDFAKDHLASSPHHVSAEDEMDKMQSKGN